MSLAREPLKGILDAARTSACATFSSEGYTGDVRTSRVHPRAHLCSAGTLREQGKSARMKDSPESAQSCRYETRGKPDASWINPERSGRV
jgi:hypothetical protein